MSYVCVGRDELAESVVASAFENRAVLLFGGRQAGKTTLLKHIRDRLNNQKPSAGGLAAIEVAVFIDLMTLRYDATPPDFYRLLTTKASAQMEKQVCDYKMDQLPSEVLRGNPNLETFAQDMRAILGASRTVRPRILFLLDESSRILATRFPRAFQDNLFALLYSEELGVGEQIAFVFAGAQDLYRFCEDDTSPIGSRAAREFVTNLDRASVQELVRATLGSISEDQVDEIAEATLVQTGGHAGLSLRFIREAQAGGNFQEEAVTKVCRSKCRHLLRLWHLAFSREATAIQGAMRRIQSVTIRQIAQFLEASGFDRFEADRVSEELCFTGVACSVGKEFRRANELYWDYVDQFGEIESQESRPDSLTQEVWRLIERLEITARQAIEVVYEGLWPGKSVTQMKKTLASRWEKIEAIRAKSESYYQLSAEPAQRNHLECMYLGDLTDLVMSNAAWAKFKPFFRDKREYQDMIAAVTPVRSDRAHFVEVPTKELERCRIACDDLIVIFERILEERARDTGEGDKTATNDPS